MYIRPLTMHHTNTCAMAQQAGVKENVTRVESKEGDETSKRDLLSDKLNKVLDKQRLYFKAVQTFQQECKRNETLRATVQQLAPTPPTPATAPAPPVAPPVPAAALESVPDL